MGDKTNKPSLFERAMRLADRFFDGVDALNKMGEAAQKQNVEFFDEKIPGFKNSFEESMKSAAAAGDKLEERAEKLLFGKDLYLGAGGKERKARDEKMALDEKIKDAKARADSQASSKAKSKEKESER